MEGYVNEPDSLRQRVLYSFGRVGGGVYDGFNSAILSLYLGGLTNNNFVIGYLSNSKTMEGVVIQPLIGRWSDRTAGPLGRRRPFILAGAPLSALFLVLAARAGHAGGAAALPLVALAICLFSICYNVAGDPYDALMVDITPQRRLPTFNAVLNVVSLLGYVGITLYASIASLKGNNIPDSVFYLTAGAIVLGYAVVFFGVREPARAGDEARRETSIPLRVYIAEIRAFREAFKFLLGDFFFWNGLFTMLPFLNRFMTKTIGISDSKALIVNAVLILTAAACAYPAGRLGRSRGYKGVVVVGCVILIAASLLGLVVNSYAFLFPVAALAGCGYAAVNALLYPYMASLVPHSKIGVFTGVRTAFSAIATPISVGAASLLIDVFGYRGIFVVVMAAMALAILMFLSIDERAATEQIARVEAGEAASLAAPIPVPVA
jgi:maltose/moltooligosaccharide transporter